MLILLSVENKTKRLFKEPPPFQKSLASSWVPANMSFLAYSSLMLFLLQLCIIIIIIIIIINIITVIIMS